MAIQVTGLFKDSKSGQLFQSPKLELVPHLTYRGEITLDVHIVSDHSSTIGFESIIRNELQYDSSINDPYDQLIDSLETFVIQEVSKSNPDCSFTKFEYIESIINNE